MLEALYGFPGETSTAKVATFIHPVYRPFIEAAPFAVVATNGPNGLDTSPRGDGPGFVRIADEHTLLLPDRRGNNRVDTLRNIVHCPDVAVLFFIPGVGETLRVSGQAGISVEPSLLASFEHDGKPPRSVIVIRVSRIFFQCQRALVRSRLWDPAAQIARSALPSTGTILGTLSEQRIDGEAYDAELAERVKRTLY